MDGAHTQVIWQKTALVADQSQCPPTSLKTVRAWVSTNLLQEFLPGLFRA
jgi:hypothetical protein